MTLAELRVLVEGLDRRGLNAPIRSVALTLLARNAQDDGMAPQAETDVEVDTALFGLVYCSIYLCVALDVDFKELVARAHDCFEITKDRTIQFRPGDPDAPR
jgi:hypothetical protein